METYPKNFKSVLAHIQHQNDKWYEVVYYDQDRHMWCSCSRTFDDGEQVIEWKYVDECLKKENNMDEEYRINEFEKNGKTMINNFLFDLVPGDMTINEFESLSIGIFNLIDVTLKNRNERK